jgi:hypothetical protein
LLQVIIACPSQEQISVLMTSLLMTSQPKSTRPSVSASPPRPQPQAEAKSNGHEDTAASPEAAV